MCFREFLAQPRPDFIVSFGTMPVSGSIALQVRCFARTAVQGARVTNEFISFLNIVAPRLTKSLLS